MSDAGNRLKQAIDNPEYLLKNWISLPSSPSVKNKNLKQLSLQEAILLALRYNPNIQNAELDRILQRYQLRLANNEFELQYALAATGSMQRLNYSGVGKTHNQSWLATPEGRLKTRLGTQMSLSLDNKVSVLNNYVPVLNLNVTQPLLRGFGRDVNEAALEDAKDSEQMNKITLRQAVIDQITEVIAAYRALILSANNLQNQQHQLQEARKTYEINDKKIAAGQLEPAGNIQQSYQIESLSLMVEQADNDFKISAQNLLQTIGLDPQMRLAVPSDVDVGEIKIPDLKQSIETALANNSQYLAQQMIMRADKRAWLVAKNQQMWSLDAGINVQRGTVSNVEGIGGFRNIYKGENTSESAQLTLNIPIRDVGRRNQLIAAKVKLEKDRIQLLALKRALITRITNIISSVESQAKRYQLAGKQVVLAAQSYELEKKKLQAGISTALDVNNTQNQLIQAQEGLIAAKIAYLNEVSALQQLLGTTLEDWNIQLRFGG